MPSLCRAIYDLMTVTYIELEHAHWNQHIVLVGVVNKHGQYNIYKCTICSPCGEATRWFFAACDQAITLTKHPEAWIYRSGDFCVFVLTNGQQTDGQN